MENIHPVEQPLLNKASSSLAAHPQHFLHLEPTLTGLREGGGVHPHLPRSHGSERLF